MKNLLFLLSCILVITWAIGFLGYNASPIIHILLIISVIVMMIALLKPEPDNFPNIPQQNTDSLNQLLLSWCDSEMDRCKDSIRRMEADGAEIYKPTIDKFHMEISMYQSFKIKITSSISPNHY